MNTKLPQRRFGLEFEHVSELSHVGMARELQQSGVVVDHYATGHARCPQGCYSGWQVKIDGSISPVDKYPRGIELVSPPMFLSQAGQVKKALAIAAKYGGVNTSCGFHVHVEVPELAEIVSQLRGGSSPQMVRLRQTWETIERTMFSYVTPARRHSSYARAGINSSNRYQACNVEPLFSARRTIEFRLHNPTLNYRKALSFAALCVYLCDWLVHETQRMASLDPAMYVLPPPHKIKTRTGREFVLHRTAEKKWVIEGKHSALEGDDLRKLWEEHGKALSLSSKFHLVAWKYPQFGNAMTELCRRIGLDGPFRGYLEDRYDRVVRKFGVMGSNVPSNVSLPIAEDEDDYYNEPDLVEEDDRANI